MPSHPFFHSLLQSPGPSSFETEPAALWREEAGRHGAEVSRDAYGNSFARFGAGGSPRVMLAGHIDEIGMLITHIDEAGLLFFTMIGGIDTANLAGQRVRVVGDNGHLLGVIGRKPVHLIPAADRGKKIDVKSLWIDIGAKDKDDALTRVQPGAFAVFEQPVIELGSGRIASKALDNRVGAFIALEAVRRASEAGARAELVAAATTQEEIDGVGAGVATYRVEPDLAIAIDVTHATDVPDVSAKAQGEVRLGGGPVLEFGSSAHQELTRRLRATAEEAKIPVQLGFSGIKTNSDADEIPRVRTGAPTILLSIPNRYMHSSCEVIDMADVDAAILLLERFLCGLESVEDLLPAA